MFKTFFSRLLAVSLTLALSFSALASDKLTIVVAYPPGGDTDVIARLFATKLTTILNKPVVVENRVGAAGNIGTTHLINSPADGSTIMLSPSTLVTAPVFNPKVAKYDVLTDLTALMQISGYGMFAVVTSDTNVKSAKDLILANAAGKVTNFGSPGTGTPMHIIGELFNKEAGTDIQHIPFKGNADVVSNMLGGQIPFTWITALPIVPHVASGKFTVVGIAGSKRSPFFPNVRTLTEQGIPGIEIDSWLGFVGPRGMSKGTVDELNRALNEVLSYEDIKEKLKGLAMSPVGSTPQVFTQTLQRDTAKFRRIASKVDIRVD